MAEGFAERFRLGSRLVSTESVFTNRVDERAQFLGSWQRHRTSVLGRDASDLESPRDNVLHFYGTGGIGKSSLLRHLHRAFLEDEVARAAEIIDFESSSAFDLEELILRMRAAVGGLGIRCTAFDFALQFYWSVAHPGESIQTYTAKNSALSRLSRRFDLPGEMEASVGDIVSSIVEASSAVHGATQLAAAVTQLVRERSRVKHAVARCDDLALFLDAATVEQSLGHLPVLLAWDLAQVGNPAVTFFWDTYEQVQDRGRSQERDVQRICYLMPNVFFVVAGRNRLDWDDGALLGVLDFAGPRCWPGLAGLDGDERQMLVGELSDADADSYLSARLLVHGEAAIPPSVRQRIVEAAAGWPLYLDLAAQHFQQAIADGSSAQVEVGVPFPALVARIAADLSREERTILRGCALLESFDLDLARTAAGDVTHGEVSSLTDRDFVKRDPHQVWPMSIHATLRQALRSEESRDSWSDLDWAASARRVAERLAERVEETRDARVLRACLAQGLLLAHQYGLSTSWLSATARRLASGSGLSGIRDLGTLTTPAGALSRLCHLAAAQDQMRFADAAGVVDGALVNALSPEDAVWVQCRRADALLSAGDVRAAANAYADVLTADALTEDLACHAETMFALILLKRGRFRELSAVIDEPDCRADRNRLMGDVLRCHARWDEATPLYERGLRLGMETGDVGLQRLYSAELALVDGWTGRADPRGRLLTETGGDSVWGTVTHLIARALYEADRDATRAESLLDDAATAARTYGLREGAADVAAARGFLAALHDDGPRLSVAIREADESAQATNTKAFWGTVLRWWANEAHTQPVDWLDGQEAARTAWSQTLLARRRPGPSGT